VLEQSRLHICPLKILPGDLLVAMKH